MATSFAEKQLLKYGWKQGEGLGKNKDGVSKPILPVVKHNNQGVSACKIR